MNDENLKHMAEAVGQPLGDVLVVFLALVNALRKQPGFAEARFQQEIQELLRRPWITDIQRQALQALLDNPDPKGDS